MGGLEIKTNRMIEGGVRFFFIKSKIFQCLVQEDYQKRSKGGILTLEQQVDLHEVKNTKKKRGRMDIFVYDDEDESVVIIEIKVTDWDRIKEKKIKRNFYRYSRKLYNYIDKFLDIEGKQVTLAVIYTKPPRKKGLPEFVEQSAMEEYSFPVYWYSEVKG